MSLDTNSIIVIAAAIVVIIGFLLFRQRNRVSVRGPMGIGLEVEGSNDPPPVPTSVKTGDIESAKGGATLEAEGEAMVESGDIKANKDVRVSAKSSAKESDPKVEPPPK